MSDVEVMPRRSPTTRGRRIVELVGFALLAYVPFLVSSPGKVSADTKQYLYLDPGRFLDRALYLWDAHVGLGTVPHQQIGYLFPMGPFFWLFDRVGAPDWVAQRLWLGSIVFAAGLGARWLFREVGIGRTGALAGALVYMLTPYQLAFTARISVLLLAWAGVPFLVVFVMRATRLGGWRDPALFALTVLVIGSVNASALELVGLAPLLWVVLELCRGRDSFRRAVGAVLRIGLLCIGVSLWWLVALRTQAAYGLPVLDLTETLQTVARSSTPTDVLRGLGNWFFYGKDRLGETLEQSGDYTAGGLVEIASYAIPVLALAAAATVRWRHRAYFVLLVVVGTIVGVGAWPFGDPSVYGRVFRAFSDGTAVGLSLRNTPRVVPVIVLGLAGLLAAGVAVLAPKWRELSGVAIVGALVLVAFLPVWRVGYFSEALERDEHIPDYWEEAARAMDAGGDSTRVLEIPGSNFAAYRWGNTIEPVTPGIIDRAYVAREVLPAGTPGAVDLLDALDHRIQEGTLEPDAIAPIARLMGVGTISLRSDLEYERFATPRPRSLWHLLTEPVPTGLTAPESFGRPVPNRAVSTTPLIDALELRTPDDWADPPPVALFDVEDPVDIVRTAPRRQPVLLSGDGDGIVDAAAAGLLDGQQLVLETAALTNAQLRDALEAGADVVLTDSNRRRSQTYFDRIRDSVGETEPAGSRIDEFRLETFPGSGDASRTVVEERGGRVTASSYLTPSDRPAYAFDGDRDTTWLVDSLDAEGASIRLRASTPVHADHVTLFQRDNGPRSIGSVDVRINGGDPIAVELTPDSTGGGQVVSFPATDVRDLELTIADTLDPPDDPPPNGVGFSEIALGDTAVSETVRLPVDVARRVDGRLAGHRFDIVLARQRYEPAQRQDDELALDRRVVIPDARSFGLSGTARVAANSPDATIDAVLGTTAPGTTYASSGHLRGDIDSRASRAFDNDPATGWTPELGPQAGRWLEVAMPTATTVDHIDLTYVDDAVHAVPTQVHLEADGVPVRSMTVGPVVSTSDDGTRVTVRIPFDSFSAQRVRLVVDAVRPNVVTEGEDEIATELPVSFTDLVIPGAPIPAAPAQVPSDCRSDLVQVDGGAVPVRISGAVADARRGLTLSACEPAIELAKGSNRISSAPGVTTGIDVDRVVFSSGADGAAEPVEVLGAPLDSSGAEVKIVDQGKTSYDLRVRTAGEPFWLVLGQSQSDGWEASVNGHALGASTMVDGYANGWLVDPGTSGTLDVTVRWTPQRVVWFAIAASVLAVLACVAIVVLTWRRRRARAESAAASLGSPPEHGVPARYRTAAASTGAVVVLSVGAGVAAALVSRWWIGVVVAVATAIAGATSRGRLVLSAGAPLALALGALVDVPELGWLAVSLLVADVLVEWWRDRAADVRADVRAEVSAPG
jgi:arabinofuranan 3-O-arabinosyltransferase